MFLSTWPHMQNMFLNPWRQIHAPIQKLSRFPHRKQTILWTQRLVLAAVKALAIRLMLASSAQLTGHIKLVLAEIRTLATTSMLANTSLTNSAMVQPTEDSATEGRRSENLSYLLV